MVFDWTFAIEILPLLLEAAKVTITATAAGFVIAAIVGLLLEIGRRVGGRPTVVAVESFIQFVRGTPLLIQLYFAYFALPNYGVALPPLFTGIIVLGLHYATYMAEVFRTALDRVPRGQAEAALALGLRRGAIFRLVILPQAVPPMIGPLGNYLIAMFKDTPLLSAITVVEMMAEAKLIGSDTFRYMEPLTMAGLIFLVLSVASASLVRGLEWMTRKDERSGKIQASDSEDTFRHVVRTETRRSRHHLDTRGAA